MYAPCMKPVVKSNFAATEPPGSQEITLCTRPGDLAHLWPIWAAESFSRLLTPRMARKWGCGADTPE